MSIGIKNRKGLDLHLQGAVENTAAVVAKPAEVIAIIPDDFVGIVPKVDVHEGDTVLAGTPLFHSKADEALKVVSPAKGVVKAVVRGERRKVLRIEVVTEGTESVAFPTDGVLTDAAKARELLLASGLWAMTLQRPYAIVTEPGARLRDVFVTCFDAAPLAVSLTTLTDDQQRWLAAGVKLFGLLTSGKVYLITSPAQHFPSTEGAETVVISGPYPSSNAGTAISAISPVNKGETVMTLNLDTLLRAGELALTGKLSGQTLVALTGSEVKHPKMISTTIGAPIAAILDGEVESDGHHHRIISGNVFTGVKVDVDGFLRYPYSQVTVIPEGDDVAEFMGWASFNPSKMSQSTTFPGHFRRHHLFNPDARLLGGRRAMIMSGQYDKVTPIDILPEYLIKAILGRDIDRMEQLGIYEVAPEDFAAAEYVDTSKLELQKIVREGLDYLRKELE